MDLAETGGRTPDAVSYIDKMLAHRDAKGARRGSAS